MTQTNHKPSRVINNTKSRKKIDNEQRLGTLKLWQQHIEALSKPSSKPILKRYNEELDSFLETQMYIQKQQH